MLGEQIPFEDLLNLHSRVVDLRRLGFSVAIDGAGVSSTTLAACAVMAPDFVRLDPALLQQIHRAASHRLLVRGLCSMFIRLGSRVIATGIESAIESRHRVGPGLRAGPGRPVQVRARAAQRGEARVSAADEQDELVHEFLIESHENLDRLDRELVALEQTPDSTESLASIFRTIHTIKGTCGFLGYARLEAVAHAGESLLSRVRDGELRLDGERTSALLRTVDAIREMLAGIDRDGRDGDNDYPALIAELHRLQDPTPAVAPAAASPLTQSPRRRLRRYRPRPLQRRRQRRPRPKARTAAPRATDPGEHRGQSVSEAYVRVDVGLLDKLMNMVGELVLARNQIMQFVQRVDDQMFNATTQRLN